MRVIVASQKKPIYIGQRGENEATKVIFPKSYFSEFDDTNGAYNLVAQRKTDTLPYIVSTTSDEENVYWIVSDTDCAIEGVGSCELQLLVNTQVVKSIIYITVTGKSLDASGPVPDPYQDLVQTVAGYAQEAKGSAQEAESYAQAAKSEVDRLTAIDPDNDGNVIFIKADVEVEEE